MAASPPRLRRTPSTTDRCLAFAVLCVVVALSACGSTTSDGNNEISSASNGTPAELAARGTPNDLPTPTLDQSLSFSRPIDPFDGDVLAVLLEDRVDIINTATGGTVSSHPTNLKNGFAKATHRDGAVYITDERRPGLRQLIRIDAAGLEIVEFESTGWIDHRPSAPQPTLVTRDDDTSALLRLHPDGSIDRHTFDEGVFIKIVDGTTLMTDAEHNGDLWLVDNDLAVIDSVALGALDNVPSLLSDTNARVNQGGIRHILDLTTWEDAPEEPARTSDGDAISYPFGDGWRAELDNGTVTIVDPDGNVQLEQAAESIADVAAFAHPSQNRALVVFVTCTNRDGDVCDTPPADSAQENKPVDDESSDEVSDEPYVPPSFIEVYHFDTTTSVLTPIEVGAVTSIASLAVDSGWFAATVDGATTNIVTIDLNGVANIVEEVPNAQHDYTTGYVHAINSSGLALIDHQASELFLLTDDGVKQVTGAALDNDDSWRELTDRFQHIR